ncbi:MAG: macro domain-containing protein [Peptococcaceae bacterium]|jgi:O-acetyl-ADP-ribose deacetylase (regulator of RNase III)|nr:macro domain-containing protein [Peptococcaceae bacterium]
MPLMIIRGDITQIRADAIVNAANTGLAMGGGVCGAIFKAAGARELQAACAKVAPIKTGEAAITPGFALPAKYVIHAAGPVYSHWNAEQAERYLRAAYINSLNLAAGNGCESVAFPLISSGIYGYPKAEALAVATAAIGGWLNARDDMDVSLVVFDKEAFTVSEQLLGEVAAFIREHYVDAYPIKHRQAFADEEKAIRVLEQEAMFALSIAEAKALEDVIGDLNEPFSTALLRLIDSRGKSDVEVYKRANIGRKLFSKIRNPGYRPSKKTVVALCVALELTLDETDGLLECAGFALSRSVKFDVIVEYFITSERYDIYEINQVLFEYGQPVLGG